MGDDVIEQFYEMYRPLQRRHKLLMHVYTGTRESYIEVFSHEHGPEGTRLFIVKDEEERQCYRRAITELKRFSL